MRNLFACAILFGITCCSPALGAEKAPTCGPELKTDIRTRTLNGITELRTLIEPEEIERGSENYPGMTINRPEITEKFKEFYPCLMSLPFGSEILNEWKQDGQGIWRDLNATWAKTRRSLWSSTEGSTVYPGCLAYKLLRLLKSVERCLAYPNMPGDLRAMSKTLEPFKKRLTRSRGRYMAITQTECSMLLKVANSLQEKVDHISFADSLPSDIPATLAIAVKLLKPLSESADGTIAADIRQEITAMMTGSAAPKDQFKDLDANPGALAVDQLAEACFVLDLWIRCP
ncbi:hypothetical protein FACS189449_04190 [Alphaproteobacteria bacterium]|nr:hypothetical protein FACS189449_04190 [Alphaproteobacteria bacterium]